MSEQVNPTEKIGQIKRKMKSEGWDYVGMGQLKETRFQEDARFVEVPVRTKKELIAAKKEELKKIAKRDQGLDTEVEVRLIPKPGEMFDGIEIPDKFEAQLIFARVVKD